MCSSIPSISTARPLPKCVAAYPMSLLDRAYQNAWEHTRSQHLHRRSRILDVSTAQICYVSTAQRVGCT
eukprot:3908705-Rhodomonas_salina.1